MGTVSGHDFSRAEESQKTLGFSHRGESQLCLLSHFYETRTSYRSPTVW
jgi:hypothetical protein